MERMLARSGSMTAIGRWPALLLPLFLGTLALEPVRAGVLAPDWSRPLDAAVISASVGANTYSTQNLFLLLSDGRVLAVSANDTLRELGRAPRGAAALVAWPTPARGAADVTLMLAARSRPGVCDLVAWNRHGQQLWTTPVRGMAGIDSLFFVGESEDRAEFCAWQRGEPWLVVVSKQLWQYSASAVRLNPGFTPRDAIIGNLDWEDAPELVFFDGARLAVYHVRQGRELRCHWTEPDSALGLRSDGRLPGPRVACAVFDSTPILLVVTGDTLRYLDALTVEERRWFVPEPESKMPGPAAVIARGPIAYLAGTDQEGRDYLSRLASDGPTRSYLSFPCPEGARVHTLFLLNDWPTALISTGYGPENLFVCAPGLTGTAYNSPGYSGARLLRVIPLRIDEDTLRDLVVLRTAGDARWRLDVFHNRMDRLADELEQAKQSLQHATLGRDEKDVRRSIRRVRILSREVGVAHTVTGQEGSALDQFRLSVRRHRAGTYIRVLAAIVLAAGLGILAGFALLRRGPPVQRIEDQPLATCVALAADLISIDHNFISKGNTAAAFKRLIEVRTRHGLERDQDLERLERMNSSELRGAYSSAIHRLVGATPTLPLFDFIQTTARSATRRWETEVIEMSLDGYRQMERNPGVRLVVIPNHECPGYHQRFRLFVNAEVRGTLEHIVLDHIRHARTWADIVFSYTVSTQWNRRLLVTFRSDSLQEIPFTKTRAHITSRLRDLVVLLRPAVEVPGDASALTGPREKLWLSIADYIAVLDETRARLSGA
jgi:hypothetical protein